MAAAAPLRDEDDTGDGPPKFLVRPSENVYSYFMFVTPTEERKKHGKPDTNWDIIMAYLLVALNFFMQGVLLYMIFHEVVVSNVEWQNGIMKLGDDRIMGLLTEAPAGCNDGSALCFREHGNITCSPPSVQLTGRWQELDTNGDGIWTRKEVVAAREALKCKYVVDPVEVFDVLINMLKLRENLIWLHPNVKSGEAIHYAYFTYAMGDLIMCGYRSKEMCSNLVQRGFFDAAMKYGTAPRVGETIETALKYCTQLLQPGGTCESLLPSTYAVWKKTSEGECGSPSYSRFVYTNPGNGMKKSLLSVDYGARQEYEQAQDLGFRIFKGIIVFTWLLAMLCEFREIVKIVTLCMRYPDAEQFGVDAVLIERDPADPEDVRYRIQGLSSGHRTKMMLLSILRFFMTCVLMVVGVAYIVKTNVYADLIMNGVALLFVAEVAAVLYGQVLREEIQDQCSDIKPMQVEMYGIEWLNRRPALVDIVSVVGLFAVVFVIMRWQMYSVVLPVYESLECTCAHTGDNCVEAQKFNYDFWNNYWHKAVPGVFAEVEKLKAGAGAAAASYLSVHATAAFANDDIAGRMKALEQKDAELEKSLDMMMKSRSKAAHSLIEVARRVSSSRANTTVHQTKKRSFAHKSLHVH